MRASDRCVDARGAPGIVLLYDADAYEERPAPAGRPGPLGLMGRQVAGRSFLDAYLTHGTFAELSALVPDDSAAQSLIQFWREHPSTRVSGRTLRISALAALDSAFSAAQAFVLHSPQPPDSGFAWARRRLAPGSFALSGVTHTLASPRAVELLRGLVDAPFEPYDALICTSTAVAGMVRAVVDDYAEFLREQFGGKRQLSTNARIEVIPLGIDTKRFHPATAAERVEARRVLGVTNDEIAVLFVGRLSHHAKAHPFPMFRAAALAAEASGRAIHLLVAGWAANEQVRAAFVDGARAFSPGVQTTFLNGIDPAIRVSVWRAADIFLSLADSVQETFGLTVIEAMASALPIVASDWNGYRDLVIDGKTGYLIPSCGVRGATPTSTARLLCGSLDYDHFLAESGQATVVDVNLAASALARLASDDALRAAMAAAGRLRAVEHFEWSRIVLAYERLWSEQEAERCARPLPAPAGPEAYPAPERSFRAYPSTWLDGDDLVNPVPGAVEELDRLLAVPLVNHVPGRRVADAEVVRAALAAAPCTIAKLDATWLASGVEFSVGRATLAWMLKYNLLRSASAFMEPAATRPEV